jgi:hypothetical protein
MLQQQSDISGGSGSGSGSGSGTNQPEKKTTRPEKVENEDKPINILRDLPGINDPLPISWKQRIKASQRVQIDDDMVITCSECEQRLAVQVCDDCGQQLFCDICSNYVHRTRRNGLVGHQPKKLSAITTIPYIEHF